MRLVLAGTPDVAVPALRALLASDHEVVGVLTRPDAVAGRGRRSRPSPVRVVAEDHGVPVLAPTSPRDPDFLAELRALEPDCVPVVAYGALVPRKALDVPRHGWVNLHFSLLPAWRGAAPVQHALLAGDDVTGVTVFRLDEGMDTGPVLATMTERLRPDDTSGAVLDRLAQAGAHLLVQVMDGLVADALEAVPQASDGASRAPKLTADDAHVRFDVPAAAVDRRVRACTPAPGAWTTLEGRRLKLGPVTIAPGGPRPAAGELVVQSDEVLVGTATDAVRLGTVQPEGKRAMAATDWARGARPAPGTRLGQTGQTGQSTQSTHDTTDRDPHG